MVKYIRQILYILLFSFLGEALAALIPLAIPAAVYGLILLLIALGTGVLKEAHVAETADFLVGNMSILFVVPAVKILQYWDVISPQVAAICIISVVPTFLVFAVSGLVTKWLQGKKEGTGKG